jgi:hypothetical protein
VAEIRHFILAQYIGDADQHDRRPDAVPAIRTAPR